MIFTSYAIFTEFINQKPSAHIIITITALQRKIFLLYFQKNKIMQYNELPVNQIYFA